MNCNLLKNKNIIILGHDNIDVDSIISGILLEKLLIKLNIKASFKIKQSVISDDTKSILNKYNVDFEKYIDTGVNLNDNYLFLVDHNERLMEKNIVGCIDHHPTINKLEYPIYINKKSTSCARLIFEEYNNHNINIDREIAKLVILACCIDSCSFKSSKAVLEDRLLCEDLAKEYKVNMAEIITDGLCLTDMTLPVENLFNNGEKEYSIKNNYLKSSYIQINSFYKHKNKINEIIEYISKNSDNFDLWVFIVVDLGEDEKTYQYKINKNLIKERIYNGIKSRGSDIMPNVFKEL